MGYYIEGPRLGKESFLRANYGATSWAPLHPPEWEEIDDTEAIICAVDNGAFEAAAYCFDPIELHYFSHPHEDDVRPRKFLLMSKEIANRLTGFKPN